MLAWNTAWHIILSASEKTLSSEILELYYFAIVGLAFFAGVMTIKIYRLKPLNIFSGVFLGPVVIYLFNWLINSILHQPLWMSTEFFLLFTWIGGIGIPLIYSYYGKLAKIHEQGETYGFLESIQILSEFLGPALLALTIYYHGDLELYVVLPLLVFAALITLGKFRASAGNKRYSR